MSDGLMTRWITKHLPWLASWLYPRRRQTCWAYCPRCKRDLCSTDGVVNWFENDLEHYTCICGTVSDWLFDAPVPLLIRFSTR